MIATSRCNAAKELCSLFANGERVTALKLELLPGAAVRATIEKLVTVDELTTFVTEIKQYELKEVMPCPQKVR